jgi:hypothetical protein
MMQDVQGAQGEDGWVSFPGGELEGQPPRVLCPACRDAVNRAATARRVEGSPRRRGGPHEGGARHARTLCFACYRANLDRNLALRAAADVPASEAHFQSQLPLEPVNAPRLDTLKAERLQARVLEAYGAGRFAGRRREAQIAARQALHSLAARSKECQPAVSPRATGAAIHAAELQFPESWLPFVVAR